MTSRATLPLIEPAVMATVLPPLPLLWWSAAGSWDGSCVSVEDAPTLAGGSRVAGRIPAIADELGDSVFLDDAPVATMGCGVTVPAGRETDEDGRPAAEGVTGETAVELAVDSRSGSAEKGDCGGKP